MPTTAYNMTERRFAVQYTGSNSAEIDAIIANFVITNEAGGVLDFTSNGSPWTANATDWICFQQNTVDQIHSAALFAFYFTRYPDIAALAAVEADVAVVEADVAAVEAALADLGDIAMLSVGAAAVPLLLASASVTVPVTLYPALPDTSYTPHSHLFGGINLGPLEILSSTVISTTVVDVVVRNNGLLSLTGATLLVSAIG